MEIRLVPEAGFRLRLIDVGPLNNVSLADPYPHHDAIAAQHWRVQTADSRIQPSVVFGVGGYASGPAMAAALLLKMPTMVFEPNAMPGLRQPPCGQEGSGRGRQLSLRRRWFNNCEVTGIPVRPDSSPSGRPPAPPSPAGLWRIAGSAHLQHRICRNHCRASRRRSRAHRPPPERHAPRRDQSAYADSGADPARWQVCPFFDDMPARFAGAPGDVAQRRIHRGRTGRCRQSRLCWFPSPPPPTSTRDAMPRPWWLRSRRHAAGARISTIPASC